VDGETTEKEDLEDEASERAGADEAMSFDKMEVEEEEEDEEEEV
jgi:hypothetical protein